MCQALGELCLFYLVSHPESAGQQRKAVPPTPASVPSHAPWLGPERSRLLPLVLGPWLTSQFPLGHLDT